MTNGDRPADSKEPPKIKLALELDQTDSSDTPAAPPASEKVSRIGSAESGTTPPKLKLKLPKELSRPGTTSSAESDAPRQEKQPDEPQPQQAAEEPAKEEKPLIKLGGTTTEEAGNQDEEVEKPAAEKKEQESAAADTTTPPPPEEKPAAEPAKEEKPVIKLGGAAKEEEGNQDKEAEKKEQESAAADTTTPPPRTLAQRLKQQTVKIDDLNEESLEDLYKAALNATQRVVLDDQQKKATSRIEQAKQAGAAAADEEKKASSAKIDLHEAISAEEQRDLLKKQTIALSEEQGEPPAAEPDGDEGVATVKLQRPPADEASEEEADTLATVDKSETARIDLPKDVAAAPPTQRKTIRIKRPDASGGGPRKLNIARTTPGGAPAEAAKPGRKPDIKIDQVGDEVHPAFAAVALIAVLVSLLLVYVLAATLYPGVPFIS